MSRRFTTWLTVGVVQSGENFIRRARKRALGSSLHGVIPGLPAIGVKPQLAQALCGFDIYLQMSLGMG